MRTGYYTIARCTGTLLFLFFYAALAAQPLPVKGQPWPKLMQLYEGRVLDVKYDSTGTLFYTDWQDRPVRDMEGEYDSKKTQYLYVDSTGKPLSDKRYQHALPFIDGLAWLGYSTDAGQDRYSNRSAIINTKEEEVLPMSETIKHVLGSGLVLEKRYDTMAVYNRMGKKLAECPYCEVGLNAAMKNFWMMLPHNYWRSPEDKVVKLMNLEGRVLYSARGNKLEQVVNWICAGGQPYYSSMQPYYKVSDEMAADGNTILDRNGKVVMDSIGFSYFMGGVCCIHKNGMAAMVDTNWKFIIPFSYSYTSISPLPGHPQNGYAVYKNNKGTVVNRDNKRLVPLESTSTINYDPEQRLYEIQNTGGSYWYMTLEGDTLINPREFEVLPRQYPYIPGFFVKSRPGQLIGYINEKGKLAVPCQYDNLFYAGNDLFIFFTNKGGGYMDTKGHVKFRVENVVKLSNFCKGYAHCIYKETDKRKFTVSEKTVYNGQASYQLHDRVIDSTGALVRMETWAYERTDAGQFELPNGHSRGLFFNGRALLHNARTKKYGLINEKMQVIVPAIYDSIDLRGTSYDYTMYTVNGPGQQTQYTIIIPDIVDDKVKATLKGAQKVVDVRR